ncbi:MAG: PKD domain-containing protein [Flavobacteriales bacterium]|nr:PKD domain-containing protein [Flavobacteriales bacterium]
MFFIYFLGAILPGKVKADCPAVTASFTATPVNVCGTGFTSISFTNTSTGANANSATYKWYRNGVLFDNTSGLSNPNNSNVFAAGTYTFRLIATDPSVPCTDTAFVTVTVFPTPNAGFNIVNNNACAGSAVSFTNTSTGTTGATTYSWNFGDGGTSTSQSPSHTYAAGGTYTVTQTVTNFAGCSDVQTATVTILDAPTVSISGDDGDGDLTNCLLPGNPSVSETVNFTSVVTNATSILWNFGDGNTSTLPNPSHTYTSYGTYTVTLTATHANGCTTTATLTVVFEKYVSASMTLDITEYSGCAPHTLTTLQNLSVNANTYTWNFGDGSPPVVTTSSTPPPHVYTTSGTYTISLTAANSCNMAMATISPIVIVAGPNSNFTSSLAGLGNLGCAPQNVTYSNLSSGAQPANNYFWSMGNGNTYTNVINPPAQTYPTQGTYQVMLIAGNACGFDTTITNIVIDSIPIAAIIANPLEGCTPLTVNVTNNSSGNNASYAWYVDGVFTSSAYNLPSQVFTAPPGNTAVTHTVSLTVSNHCGVRSDAESILVHPAVDAIFTISDDTICVGQSISITDASRGDMLNWTWDFGDGTSANTQGPFTHTYASAGTYVIKDVVSGFCGTDSLLHTVVVLPYPVADISASPITGCIPHVVNFTNNSTPGGTNSWSFGTGSSPATSTAFTPSAVTYSTAGTSQVIYTVNVLGCSSSDTVSITTFPLPVVSFTATPTSGCSPLNVAFNNTSPVIGGESYSWNFGNGNTSNSQSPGGQTYTTTGVDSTYTVTLTITSANGCTSTATTTILVHPLPIADFTPLPDTVCALTPIGMLNNSTGASSFQWSFGDGGTSTAISPSHNYSNQGTFTVQLIAITGFSCRDTVTHAVVIDSIPSSAFTSSIVCFGDTTEFSDLSTGTAVGWSWDFGDASPVSTLQNPDHVYAAAGTYSVTLTTTNGVGCTNSITQNVIVNAVPVANFVATSFCLGSATQFTDQTSGVPVAWNWDFGDGSTSTLQHPSHTYAATGIYTVTLISFGGAGCSDTISHTITITGIPTADFSFQEVCTHDTTIFVSQSLGNPDTYVWNFGDGTSNSSNLDSLVHVYNTASTYTVTLTAGFAASGCTNSISYTVDAFPRTNPSFTSNTPCLGGVTNFSDVTSGNPNQWQWNFGDGSPVSSLQNPIHTYTNPGTFSITLITENAFGCVDSLHQNIQVFPLPVAAFSNDTICDGFATAFVDLSTSPSQWHWNFGDASPVSTLQNPFHLFPSSGTYNVELIVTNSFGCTDTVLHTVTVNPNPTANFSFTTACFSYPTNFTDASINAIDWQWDLGEAGSATTVVNPVYTYGAQGNYSAQLIVTNVFGCKDTLVQSVSVLPQPEAGFVNTTVCAGQTVIFTDTSLGSPVQWTWDFGDGTPLSNTQNPSHDFLNGGIYNVTLISGNPSGCLDTTTVAVEVYTVPDAAFSADTVCLFNITHFSDLTVDSAALTSWFWDFGDGNNSFAENPTYIYQNPGIYNVTFTVSNIHGCDTTMQQAVVVNDVPVAAFTADTVCLGSPTIFTDVSTGFPTQWTWSFGDGNVATGGPIVSHLYTNAGSYIVTLVAEGAGNNCSDFTFGVVTVSADAIAGVSLPDTLCAMETFTFTDNSTINFGTVVSQTWDMGDGSTFTSSTGSYAYTTPGIYFVTHTVTSSGGCVSQVVDTIVVNELPNAQFSSNSGCSGIGLTFTDLSTINITNWNWNFGDGFSDNVQSPTHNYVASGNYNVELIVTNNFSCKDTIVQNILVFGSPTAAFTNNVTCLGTPVSFFDASTVPAGDTIAGWFWDFGDGSTSVLPEDQHVFNAYSDTFYVTFVVITTNGCTDTIVQPVATLPIVNFDYFPSIASGCAPLNVHFTDQSTTTGNANVVSWVWDFGDGFLSFGQSPDHIYMNDGSYYVSVQVTTSDGCIFSDTLTYPIVVYPQPVANFEPDPYVTTIYQPDIQVNDLSSGAVLWEYSFGDGQYSNESSPMVTYYEPNTYTITQIVTNEFGCRDTISRNVVIEEVMTFFAPNAISPDGNGRNDNFFVTGSNIVKIHWMVFDRWGEKLFDGYSINDSWDATYKGEAVKQDVYVWKANVEYANGDIQDYYGHVTVLRR